MKLSLVRTLLGGGRQGPSDIEITDLAYDSRHVAAGSLFFCISGRSFDGHDFAQDAIRAGAVALVVERPLDLDVPQIVVPQVRDAMTAFAAPFYGTPSHELKMLGVTGTNGKTTTTFMAHSIFQAMGDVSGLIGTVETRVGDIVTAGVRTTPESIDIQRLLRDMVSVGARHVAIEVTSEGMSERRLVGTRFRSSVFTNLSQDHLNYHGSMDSYYSAKAQLFTDEYSDSACVNIDDRYGARLAGQMSIPCTTFGIEQGDVRALDVVMREHGSAFRAVGEGLDLAIDLPLPGPFNIYNALAAVVGCEALEVEATFITEGIATLKRVPGRFESVDLGQPFSVVIDYAHTPDGISNVCAAARAMTNGAVVMVFGCGGDRDRSKRPLMGLAASQGADLVFITSDNPRSEDPAAIVAQIEAGMVDHPPLQGYQVVIDRREAIRLAIESAAPGDVVVIAGKGHERGQEFADVTIPFDDREVATAALRELARR